MKRVQIALFDGFDLLDALAPYEVFAAAEAYTGGALSVELVTAEGARDVPSGTKGLTIAASGALDPNLEGIILVPGASGDVDGDEPDSVPTLLAKAAETGLTEAVGLALGKPGMTVATVCGGSLALAMGGLLEGRHAVTHHLGMEVLSATGAVPVQARVVDDGDLVTGGGVTSGLDVALYLLEREFGSRVAIEVERLFEYERRGTVWKSEGYAPSAKSGQSGAYDEDAPGERELAQAKGEAAVAGTWEIVLSTPIGKLDVVLEIEEKGGRLEGTAKQGEERADLIDLEARGNRLTWMQSVTKPLRLNLKFDARVDGDEMTGTAKAGLLPASKFAGTRVHGRRNEVSQRSI
ncbi:DJ-1/PfpI family protein [Cohnella sp.]|uniref:DJ-1/PfpI family protein n=1 Tax=Cohnella sp. TaxID=1883426 RepID=UPI0035645EB1